ncbi:uncharacterized protein BN772_02437 [Bacteroides sp. CAG:754]|nr:uncharacterized protein BN772_02437 [Bacteroides sp. CAG:754]
MKKYISHILCMAAVGCCLTACSDFLDVTPRDKVLEADQYATETGIQGALNGLYRQFISTDLYGGNLSYTSLDAMGHFYAYPPVRPSGTFLSQSLFFLCNGSYEEYESVESLFSGVWSKAYNTLFNINFFLKSMEESNAVINADNKDVIMGEAYGLRAYLHFDLFRLFGPRWEGRSEIDKVLPYNRSTDVILNHIGYEESVYSTADEYMQYLLADIRTAERLLRKDPVLSDDATVISKELVDNFYKNRNRRMNYYAVKALEARVLQYMGDHDNASIAAQEVTDQVGNLFKWVDLNKMAGERNFIFFEEVVFGINNPDMISNYNNYFEKTRVEDIYAVDHNNLLQNIYAGFGDNLRAIIDIRAQQWVSSKATIFANYSLDGTYISKKYNIAASETQYNALENFQPLVRITEMYYIQAETALRNGNKQLAMKLLNDIFRHRGIPETHPYYLTENSSDEEITSHICCEYYKEFYGEGQVYFYHKRLNNASIFTGYEAGSSEVGINTYKVPIPKSETDI